MAESHVFSTGILRIGAPGATALTSADVIGVVQDVTLDTTYTRKDLFDTAQNSVYAVDTADHEGKFMLKITTADFARKLLTYLTGGVKTTAGSVDTYTISGPSKPLYCRVEFDGVDTNGKNIKIVMPRSKAPGFSTALKLTDFANMTADFSAYADQANNNLVATVAIDQ